MNSLHEKHNKYNRPVVLVVTKEAQRFHLLVQQYKMAMVVYDGDAGQVKHVRSSAEDANSMLWLMQKGKLIVRLSDSP